MSSSLPQFLAEADLPLALQGCVPRVPRLLADQRRCVALQPIQPYHHRPLPNLTRRLSRIELTLLLPPLTSRRQTRSPLDSSLTPRLSAASSSATFSSFRARTTWVPRFTTRLLAALRLLPVKFCLKTTSKVSTQRSTSPEQTRQRLTARSSLRFRPSRLQLPSPPSTSCSSLKLASF